MTLQQILDTPIVGLIAVGVFFFGVAFWVFRVNGFGKRIDGLDEKFNGLETKFDDFRSLLERVLFHPRNSVLEAESPVKLNALGQKIAEAFGAPEWAEATALVLSGRPVAAAENATLELPDDPPDADALLERPPYDIEAFCFDFVKATFPAAFDERIRACAYETGVARETVLQVLAVQLRDALQELAASADDQKEE